jgi:predicted kinase
MNQKVKILRGITSSGKSTYAKELEYKGYEVLSYDRLRAIYPNLSEKEIKKIYNRTFYDLLCMGKNIVLDNMHIKASTLNDVFSKIRLYVRNNSDLKNVDVELVDISASLKEALKRNESRENSIPPQNVKSIYNKWVSANKFFYYEFAKLMEGIKKEEFIFNNDKNCIIIDIDGTLAKKTPERKFYEYNKADKDTVNSFLLSLLPYFKQLNYSIIICTGREDYSEDVLINWLNKYNVDYDALYMRKSNDNRPDSIVKFEIFKEINEQYNIITVFDDRESVVEMARSWGLNVYQVNEGNF